jgi:hypothetical protein
MDRIPHTFPRARSSTHRTSLLHRPSRPRTLRYPWRLSRRVFSGFSQHHSTRRLRRRLRSSSTTRRARNSPLHRASTARPRSIHGSPPRPHGAPGLCAPSRPPLQLLPRPPSPNLQRITTMDDSEPVRLHRLRKNSVARRIVSKGTTLPVADAFASVESPWKSGPFGPRKPCKITAGFRPSGRFRSAGYPISPQPLQLCRKCCRIRAGFSCTGLFRTIRLVFQQILPPHGTFWLQYMVFLS